MRLGRAGELGLVFLFLLALLGVRAFSAGLDAPRPYEPGEPAQGQQWFRLDASAAELEAQYGGGAAGKYRGGDLASYLAAGEALLEQGTFEHGFAHLWPPGMAVVVALVLAVSGPAAYGAKMVAAAVLLWALALTAAWALLRPLRSRALAAVLLAAPLLLPSLGTWTFGFGAIMSESISSALFVAFLAVFVAALGSERPRDFAIAGLLLGLATLVRAFYEYVGAGTFGLAALALGVAWARTLLRGGGGVRAAVARAKAELRSPTPAARFVACWLAGYLAFAGVLLPWRLYKLERWGDARLVSTSPGYMFAWGWTPDEQVPSFLHAANTPCKTDPKLCALVQKARDDVDGRLAQRFAMITLLMRPGRWLGHKLADTDWLWLGRPWSEVRTKTPGLLVEGLALGLAGLVGALLVLREAWRRRTRAWLGLAWATCAFIGWNAAFFALYYHEWRYSMPARLFAAQLPLLYLALKRRDERVSAERRAPPPSSR